MKQLNRPLKALSLFTGIGGLDLAAMRWGIQPIAFCEIDPFPCAVLRKRFPFIPILDDIRKVDGTQFGTVDIVYGGFPCQDLSQAGRKAGLVDGEGNVTRSGLWFEMLRIIREVRPSYVVVENVRGAVNSALPIVESGLEEEGYEVWSLVVPASAFGAPHQRERLFVFAMAHVCRERMERSSLFKKTDGNWTQSKDKYVSRSSEVLSEHNVWRTPDANITRGSITEEKYQERLARGMPNTLNYQVMHETQSSGQLNPYWIEQLMGYPEGWTDLDCDDPKGWKGWPAFPGEPQYDYEYPRTCTGMKDRVKRLKALGNSVVPVQAEPFFSVIPVIEDIIHENYHPS